MRFVGRHAEPGRLEVQELREQDDEEWTMELIADRIEDGYSKSVGTDFELALKEGLDLLMRRS